MERYFPENIQKHWQNAERLIQVIVGPRQVGKTTAVTKLAEGHRHIFESADLPSPPDSHWIVEQWQRAREMARSSQEKVYLILDEIQKIPRWSETVKGLWDADQRDGLFFDVWLLGSSALQIEKGLSESLMGRFEVLFFPHWTFHECRDVFGATLSEYIRWGGYPGIYRFRDDPDRADQYLQTSIIEPTLGRDILAMHAVDKPALLRQLFWFCSRTPCQIVSYEKILSHLQGKGNSATLVHYAELLAWAFIMVPIYKYSTVPYHTKKSIPKWLFPNMALISEDTKNNAEQEGFVFENLVGAHIANLIYGKSKYELKYWREESREIDFILCRENQPVFAIEVKSGRARKAFSRTTLDSLGLTDRFAVVDRKSIEDFLSRKSVDELVQWVGQSGAG